MAGSQEAYAILDEMGETGFKNYPKNMKKMQNHISGLDRRDWTQNLYWSWLYTLKPLTEAKGRRCPKKDMPWIRTYPSGLRSGNGRNGVSADNEYGKSIVVYDSIQ
ncbi:MAG: DUF3160 domain-containing protein [Parabacteroides sp.]|nr:DUF3160 domain-containing protein [Parabacteroides sp.]